MQTVTTGVPPFGDYTQSLCQFNCTVGTNCVTTPSDTLLGEYCSAVSNTVHCYESGDKRHVTKKDRPVRPIAG